MIKQFKDYAETQAYSDSVQLPRGGYVCKIIGAKVETNDKGQSIKVAFDISEGDYSGHFAQKFAANTNEDKKWPGTYTLYVPKDDGSQQDGWTKRRFKTFTNALEDSNEGYHFDWDETKFKGKLVGLVFNYREWSWNGKTGMAPNPANATSVAAIREGKYKIPQDRYLNGSAPAANNAAEIPEGFVNVPAGADEEIPF